MNHDHPDHRTDHRTDHLDNDHHRTDTTGPTGGPTIGPVARLVARLVALLTRSRRHAAGADPLAIRDLSEHPALRAAMAPISDDAPISLEWARLIASGPIRFDRPALERAA